MQARRHLIRRRVQRNKLTQRMRRVPLRQTAAAATVGSLLSPADVDTAQRSAETADAFSGFSSGNGGRPPQQSEVLVAPAAVQQASQRLESAASDISRYESASSVMAEALPAATQEPAPPPTSLHQLAAAPQSAPAPQRRSAFVAENAA